MVVTMEAVVLAMIFIQLINVGLHVYLYLAACFQATVAVVKLALINKGRCSRLRSLRTEVKAANSRNEATDSWPDSCQCGISFTLQRCDSGDVLDFILSLAEIRSSWHWIQTHLQSSAAVVGA